MVRPRLLMKPETAIMVSKYPKEIAPDDSWLKRKENKQQNPKEFGGVIWIKVLN